MSSLNMVGSKSAGDERMLSGWPLPRGGAIPDARVNQGTITRTCQVGLLSSAGLSVNTDTPAWLRNLLSEIDSE